MTAKIFSILIMAISTLFSSSNVLAGNQSDDGLQPLAEFDYIAENETVEENKQDVDDDEEPDCD